MLAEEYDDQARNSLESMLKTLEDGEEVDIEPNYNWDFEIGDD